MSFVLIKDVTKRFGTVTAVDNISLTVNKGEIFGLVGSDGAGKSTLLRMAATMIPPDSGQISIKGLDVVNNRMEVKGIMGYMPQRFGLYHDLTVNENMEFFMDIFGIFGEERKRRLERYLGFSNLMPFLDRLAGKLSGA
jgi:ABC-2 type transport system ATP-binding protein